MNARNANGEPAAADKSDYLFLGSGSASEFYNRTAYFVRGLPITQWLTESIIGSPTRHF